MKNRIIAILLAMACLLALSACSCSHESWIDGDSGKVCESCGISFCEVNGHSWFAATCEAPKTCENCGLTEGEALGHSWTEADCDTPKTCRTCNATEGEALGHGWLDATTEAPKTCEVCGLTEGERIITDERFKTEACSALFGKWEGAMTIPGDAFEEGFGKYLEEFSCFYVITFNNDGNANVSVRPTDEDYFIDAMTKYTMDIMYDEFAASGIDKATADALFAQAYGVTMEEYVASEMAKLDMEELFSAMNIDSVYYVEGDQIYLGYIWSSMDPSGFYFEGETLYIDMDGEYVAFTRVEE